MLTLGIDFSQHLGLTWHSTTNRRDIIVRVLHGDPIYQLNTIESLIGRKRNVTIAYEILNSMRNKRTVESLLGGMGYIRWSLRRKQIPFIGYTVPQIRNGLQIPGKINEKKYIMQQILQEHVSKEVSDNHSDAVAILLYHLHKNKLQPFNELLKRYRIKVYVDKSQKRKSMVKPFK